MSEQLHGDLYEVPALEAAPERPHFGNLEYVGNQYHYGSDGNQIGEETYYISNGEPRVTFWPTDTLGVTIASPFEATGIRLEGDNGISGVAYHTVERDNLGRPKKIMGYRVSDGFAGHIAGAIDGQVSGESQAQEFPPGDYEEILLKYDTATGQLGTIEKTEEYDGGIAKTIHRNVFNAHGQRTGYIKSELSDIEASTGRENHDVTQVILYENNGSTWREITYSGFQDGLVPVILKEGVGDKPFDGKGDVCYLGTDVPREQWPYQIAVSGPMTSLIEQEGLYEEDGFGDRARTVSLPTWIPKAAAYDIASQTLPLDEAAATPYFPETSGATIMSREEAFERLSETESPEQICELINGLKTGQEVVLQPIGFPLPLLREIRNRSQDATEMPGMLSDVQKVGIIAAMHPVFGREEMVSSNPLAEVNDRRQFDRLLTSLALDKRTLTQRLYSLDGLLSQDIVRCFSYLLADAN